MRALLATLFCCALPLVAGAQNVSLAGHMGRKALLVVDGQTVTLGVGETARGVKLLALDDGRARVEWGGKVSVLVGGGAPVNLGAGSPAGGNREIVLPVGPGGHFLASGAINGRATRFMVDTGATMVAMGQAEADRLGIDYAKGERGMVQTANGAAPAYVVTLSAVTVGNVTIANVQALVTPMPMPMVLLGNSFLSRFQMRRESDVMRLELR